MDRIIIAERKGAAARIALLEEKAVREIHYFDAGSSEQANALYLARVQTVRPALNAAFVDIGSETEAFLPLEGEKLRPGDYLIVQGFATQTNPDKRYRVSRKVQLSGRTLVYQPGRARVSVSSAIGNAADRQRLKALAERLLRQGEGVILRTAAETAAEAEIETELSAIVDLGGTILDVFIEHKVYGTISAPLNISSKRDIQNFIADLKSGVSTPLKNITGNYHYHTIEAKNSKVLDEIADALQKKGFLIEVCDSVATYRAKDYSTM